MKSKLFLYGFLMLGLVLGLLWSNFYSISLHSVIVEPIAGITPTTRDQNVAKSNAETTKFDKYKSEIDIREKSLIVNHSYTSDDLEILKKRLVNYEKLVMSGELDFDLSTALFLYEEHLRNIGYLFSFEDSDYRSYSLDALLALGEQGDTKALIIMSNKLRESYLDVDENEALSNWQESIAANHMAVAYGATQPLGTIALAIETQKLRGQLATLEQQQIKEVVLEMLSLYQVGILRGDSTMLTKAQALVDKYQVDISKKDKEVIYERGLQKYSEFTAVREKLGLDEFDNAVPAYVAVVDALMKDKAEYLTLPPSFHLNY